MYKIVLYIIYTILHHNITNLFSIYQIKFDNKVVKKKRIWSLNELITVDGKTSSQVLAYSICFYF